MILDIAAGQISMRFGFRGPNYAVVSACASSTHAIMEGFNLIRLGKVILMLTGGSESVILKAGVGGIQRMKALSERNDELLRPVALRQRPRWICNGRGAGLLVLEELEHAKARGANIIAKLQAPAQPPTRITLPRRTPKASARKK
jgi:3-oxoacyl-[acyl-carrier-protein] synthase II